MINKRTMGICLSLYLLSGCMVGPNYKAPENNVPNEWATEPQALSQEEEPLIEWWKVFHDDLLTKYIEKAVRYNKDVLVAEANILQARALKTEAASSLFPQINADFNGTKTYFSKNGPLFAIGPATGNSAITTSSTTGLPFTVQIPQIQPLYNALFDVTWELDLFGRTRRQVQAARAHIGSTVEQRNDTLLTIMAEIAKNYVEVRSYQKMARLIEENIALIEQNKEIVLKNFEQGLYNKLNYEQIEVSLANAKAALPSLVASVYQGIYAISVLIGETPETLLPEMLPVRPLPKIPKDIAVGLKSDLLRRRPDVRYAERQLAQATANVGVAVGNFYPTITLLGEGGFQSLKINNLFSMQSRTWAVGGDISLPIFQGGNLIGTLRANRALAEAAAMTYQKTVLSALQEAESSLIAYKQNLLATHSYKDAAEKTEVLLWLTRERNEKGLVNLIDVIQSEQNLVAAEENLLNSETTSLVDLISLYKALGGGWQPFTQEKMAEKEKEETETLQAINSQQE